MGKTKKARGPLDCPPGISKAFIQKEKLRLKFKRGGTVSAWRKMFGKIAIKWGEMSPAARSKYWDGDCFTVSGKLREPYKPKMKGVRKSKGKGKKKAKSKKSKKGKKIGKLQVGRRWMESNCEDALGAMKQKKIYGADRKFMDTYCPDKDALKKFDKRIKARKARLGGCGCEACKRLGGCPCEACQRMGGCACVRGYGPSCK